MSVFEIGEEEIGANLPQFKEFFISFTLDKSGVSISTARFIIK